MTNGRAAYADASRSLLSFYDEALPSVYGYLCARCGRGALAEELTSETFLAAVDAVRSERPPTLSVPWIIGVARHKLVDHWRRRAREERGLRRLGDPDEDMRDDPWEIEIDAIRARDVLGSLFEHHKAVLTFRYLDDLSVPEVAELMERTVHATEGLVVRARAAFRRAYDEKEDRSD